MCFLKYVNQVTMDESEVVTHAAMLFSIVKESNSDCQELTQ